MSLISRIFSNNPTDAVRTGRGAVEDDFDSEIIGIDILRKLIPIRNIGDDELEAFASRNRVEAFPADSILFKGGEPIDSVLYLLEGSIRMKTECGNEYVVDADSAKARFPLSTGQKHNATAHTSTNTKVLRVSNRIMGNANTAEKQDSFAAAMEGAKVPEEIRGLKIFDAYCQQFAQDNINLPTLPDVATKLRTAIAQDVSVDRLVEIVQLDAAVATKLIQVANCPLFVARERVANCRDAIVRLGLNATRNLVTSISIKQLINCKNEQIRLRLRNLWKQSAHLSCLSFVLAGEAKGVNPEEALLAGLTADIGLIPFLQFADNFPSELFELDEIEKIAPYVKGPSGRHLLQKWEFPEELAEIPIVSENWYFQEGEKLQLADIVILSRLHRHIAMHKMDDVPAINSIPACGKLKDGALSPEHSLNILHTAQDRIRETLSILAS